MFKTKYKCEIDLGIATIGAAVLGGATSRKNAKDANAFTKEMMQNKHQWEIEDLKKAGLNPILSAGNSPGIGSSAMAQTPDYAGAVAAGAKLGSEVDNIAADTNVKTQQIANMVQDIALKDSQINLNYEQAKMMAYQIEQVIAETGLTKEKIKTQGMENVVRAITTQFFTKHENVAIARELGVQANSVKGMITQALLIFGEEAKPAIKSGTGAPNNNRMNRTRRNRK